ncbi:AAA-like domain-containing protein [Brasilonema sp. CT11]|nr:AAA-like domain-containing protein [Brasilonema sp. CT11]
MNSESELSWSEIQKLADELVFKVTGSHLSDIETDVLRGAYEGKTYDEIGDELHLSGIYINKDVGNPLWKKLSDGLGEKVSKTNFKQALKRYRDNRTSLANTISSKNIDSLELPGGRVLLDSRFYIERNNVESLCYETIKYSGALIRIKAPQEMGKTSLLERILYFSETLNYKTVYLSFETDSKVFSNIQTLLRYFCASVSKQLGMPNQLDDYWDEIYGCNDNATNYFEEYLLPECNHPLVLALDKVDFVFEQPEIATDFCRLVRAWYDLARRSGHRGEIWKKLRLIVVHSTEVYSSLDINYSPLQGVGRIIALEEFNRKQIIELARRHELNWVGTEVEQLMNLIGGHPHLVRLALYYLTSEQVSLEKLLQIASTEVSPFRDHLRQHLWNLQQHPKLADTFRDVVTANAPMRLKSHEAFKLQSMGLIKTQGDNWSPSCNLYHQYFLSQLG